MDLGNSVVGNYHLDTLIGTGAMAQVYRAIHRERNRVVAVKVVWPQLAADPAFEAAFLREARAAAGLNHPNIVPIYDVGRRPDDGLLYLASELMVEGTLHAVFRRRLAGTEPFELFGGLDLMRQAADGLADAHSRNIVHQDIKPSNLLIGPTTTASSLYTLKIGDFGLVRAADWRTREAIAANAAAYWSPEQCQGDPVDARSDLYSLGVILYEIATGYPPFQIATTADAIAKHTGVAPIPPQSVRPGLPDGVQEIILRCLAKRPEERYQRAADLSADLGAMIVGRGRAPQPAALPAAPPVDRGAIGVSLVAGAAPRLTPGASSTVTVRIDNLYATVDHFRVSVVGVPAAWVSGNDRPIQLNPNEHGEVTLTITPPRSPASVAGEYPVTIQARSQAQRERVGGAPDRWIVLPFYTSALTLEPDRATGSTEAFFYATVSNGGNTTVRYHLACNDSEQMQLRHELTRTDLDLGPGLAERVTIHVTTQPRYGGEERRLTFGVSATPGDGQPPLPASATWFQQPLPAPVAPPPPPPVWYPPASTYYPPPQPPPKPERHIGRRIVLIGGGLALLGGGGAAAYVYRPWDRYLGAGSATATPRPAPTAAPVAPQPTITAPTSAPIAATAGALPPTPVTTARPTVLPTTLPAAPSPTTPAPARPAPVITLFPLPNNPGFIAVTKDGDLWITERDAQKILRVSSKDGTVKGTFLVNGKPEGITAGSDGNLWFTTLSGNAISRITPDGAVAAFPVVQNGNLVAGGITSGPDGNIWYTDSSRNKIGRLPPAGKATEFDVPATTGPPRAITAGPDGNLWFVAGKIGKCTPDGKITDFPISGIAGLGDIAAGPDGNLWLAGSDAIGRVTPAGVLTTFRLPAPNASPSGITAGPDGNVWYVENLGNKVARVTPQGAITTFPLPQPADRPAHMATAPGNALWFTVGSGAVGRVQL